MDADRGRLLPVLAHDHRQGRREYDCRGGTLVVVDPNAGSVQGLGTLFDPGHQLVAFVFGAHYQRDGDLNGTVELHVPHLNLFSTELN